MKYQKKYQKHEETSVAGFFHGIDPASKNDYYTDIVHMLTSKPKLDVSQPENRFTWVPFLVGAMRLKHRDPNEIMDLQVKMFNKFPPNIVKIDSSREDFLANAMIRKYGEKTVFPVKFLNSGNSNTKYHLKQIGYSYIHAGYQWPNQLELEKTHPNLAKIIKILQIEMKHEQVTYTDSGRITFKHPINKHNDLVHGWELSLDAVMQYQQKQIGYEKMHFTQDIMKNQEQKFFDEDAEILDRPIDIFDQDNGRSAFREVQ